MIMKDVYDYIDKHQEVYLKKLAGLIQQPSISAKGEGLQECAKIVKEMLKNAGFSTLEIPEREGYPVVYGRLTSKNSDKTLLFYDHYDVQPPEPLEKWESPPFSGRIKNGRIYGRGSSDNKGNIVSRIMAVKALLETKGDIPVNVKFVVEGEEEIGSPHLEPVINEHRDRFSSDAVIWEFGGTNNEGRPEIYLGLKGVLSVELRGSGASRDVHSANAPLIPNPAWRLVWALNTLKNQNDEVLIKGFHDNVESPSPVELKMLEDIPLEEEELKKKLGLKSFLGNISGMQAKKRLLFNPTCTINGFLTGYTGSGSKTVLPNEASVKLDFRLVANQRSSEILKKLVDHLEQQGFRDVKVIPYGSTEPVKTPPEDKFVDVVANAALKVYKKKTVVYPTSAGSGPMHLFRDVLQCPIVSAGCSHADAKGHAPNENLTIEGFAKGTKFMATILHDFSCNTKTTCEK